MFLSSLFKTNTTSEPVSAISPIEIPLAIRSSIEKALLILTEHKDNDITSLDNFDFKLLEANQEIYNGLNTQQKKQIKTQYTQWIASVKSRLSQAFNELKTSEDAKKFVDSLLALKKFNELYSQQGVSELSSLFQTEVNYFFDVFLQEYISLHLSEKIKMFTLRNIIDYFLPILEELSRLDEFLIGDNTFTSLSQQLKERGKKFEQDQLNLLLRKVVKGDYYLFIELYQQVQNSIFLDEKEIAIHLKNIYAFAVEKTNRLIVEMNKYAANSFIGMSEEELSTYFKSIIELKSYYSVSDFFQNKPYNHNETELNEIFNHYNKKVKSFIEYINTLKNISHSDFTKLYTPFFEKVRTVLSHLPTTQYIVSDNPLVQVDIHQLLANKKYTKIDLVDNVDATEVHYNLRHCINEHQLQFITQLQLACATYETLPITEYSDDLPPLFEFVASIQEHYPQIYTQLQTTLTNNILSFIQGNPENHGWDVNENNSILMKKKGFIPMAVWDACKTNIHTQANNADKQIEIESRELSNLSIEQLTTRLAKLSNENYGQLVKQYLTVAIAESIENIKELIKSNSFPKIIQALDVVWLDLQYYSENNSTIDSRWQCDVDLTAFYEEVTTQISAQFETMLTKFSTSLASNQDSFTAIQDSLSTLQAFIFLCASKNRNSCNSLYATLNAQKYLGCIQNILNFYTTMKDDCSTNLAKNKFAELLLILKLLQNHTELLHNFFDLILDSKLAPALQELGLQFHGISNNDKHFLHDFMKKIQQHFAQLNEDAALSAKSDPRIKSTHEKDKKAFHETIFTAYEGLKNYHTSGIHTEFDDTGNKIIRLFYLSSLLERAKNNILENLFFIQQQALAALPREVLSVDEKAYLAFNTFYENLIIAQETCQDADISVIIKGYIQYFQEYIAEKLQDYVATLLDDKDKTPKDIADCLLKLKIMGLYVGQFKVQTIAAIESVLTAVINNNFSQCDIPLLNQALDDEPTYTSQAKLLQEEHAVFKSFVIALRNKATLYRGIDYVCKKLENNSENTTLNINLLKEKYGLFEHKYWEYVRAGLESDIPLTSDSYLEIIQKIITSSDTNNYPTKIVELAACLFAYWSIDDYKKRSGSKPITDINEALMLGILQPHPAQVISIFRLLGIDVIPTDGDDITHYLQSHLAEIPTGEGKSITLAVTAIILALLGYEVDCACYSNYLSQRDYEAFYPLFCAFGVEKKIFYGTFKDLSERTINEQHGDVREQVESVLRGTKSTSSKKMGETSARKKRILLFDELDVFFSLAFCGSTYPLSLVFSSSEITQLIEFIWDEYNKNKYSLTPDSVKNNPLSGYNALIKKLTSECNLILNNAIIAMIEDAGIFKSQKSNFVFDKATGHIGYQDKGQEIEYNIAYRYQKMFAYIDYFKEGKITREHLYKQLGLLIECGEFAYAQMPRDYEYIFGATATLATLGDTEKSLLEAIVKAKKSTYMSSVYEKKQAEFPNDWSVNWFSNEIYFDNLTEEIKNYREGKPENSIVINNQRLLRPVMVFFKSSEELNTYYTLIQKKGPFPEGTDIIILDEQVPKNEREDLISRAGLSGAILLSTKSFCRGTDFKCRDKKIDALGGPHAIGTFFPDDIAEETQIKGRTARQGGNGSFSMVLKREELQEEYSLESSASFNKAGMDLYLLLANARTEKLAEQHRQHIENSRVLNSKHQNTVEFMKVLATPSSDFAPSTSKKSTVLSHLNRSNIFKTVKVLSPKSTKVYRTACLIDATYSMDKVLKAVKNTARMMYEQAIAIVKNNQAQLPFTPEIEIEFVFYRNYNSGPQKLLVSIIITKDNFTTLTSLFNNVNAENGWGNEAVEEALAHVNRQRQQNEVQQIVWIGDMPPNTEQEVEIKRQGYVCLNPSTNFNLERAKIIEAQIPIHSYWVDSNPKNDILDHALSTLKKKREVKAFYQETAILTHGKHGQLSTNEQGSHQLAVIITEQILENIGGEALVEAYRAEYHPTHTQASMKGPHLMFNPSSASAPTTATTVSNIIIPREEIHRTLQNYLSETAENWYAMGIHYNGRADALKLLEKLNDSAVDDEKISQEFMDWGKKPGTRRNTYTEAHALPKLTMYR
jgi:hypothetical protein